MKTGVLLAFCLCQIVNIGKLGINSDERFQCCHVLCPLSLIFIFILRFTCKQTPSQKTKRSVGTIKNQSGIHSRSLDKYWQKLLVARFIVHDRPLSSLVSSPLNEQTEMTLLLYYCTISIDSSVTRHRTLWSGPNFGTCHMSH